MPVYPALRNTLRKAYRAVRAHRYRYERLVEVRVSRACLLHNYRVFQSAYPAVSIAPVLKSNAYGHGLVHAARIFGEVDPPFLVVESYHEALILRTEGIRDPILVAGYTAAKNILCSRLKDVAYTLVDLSQLRALAAQLRRPQHFHLKVDTGMHRYGITMANLAQALHVLGTSRHMVVDGACSHMAKATSADHTVAQMQIRAWNAATRTIRQHLPTVRFLHLASTAGSDWSNDIDANVIRLGLGVYGFDSCPRRTLPLKPALSMVSTVGAVRRVAAGDGVGYGHTFVANRPMTVATVASGYHAGLDIRLSNCGYLTVRGTHCPIVGRVCMNGTMIDVSNAAGVCPGDEAVLISRSPEDPNTVDHIAETTGASRHVILTGISPSLRRAVV